MEIVVGGNKKQNFTYHAVRREEMRVKFVIDFTYSLSLYIQEIEWSGRKEKNKNGTRDLVKDGMSVIK